MNAIKTKDDTTEHVPDQPMLLTVRQYEIESGPQA